jgi:hypothetical protein
MTKLELLPEEIKFIVISNLDSNSKINLISTSKLFLRSFLNIRKKAITELYLYNFCDNISLSTKKSIMKNDNLLLNLKYKINLLKNFNNAVKKRYFDG